MCPPISHSAVPGRVWHKAVTLFTVHVAVFLIHLPNPKSVNVARKPYLMFHTVALTGWPSQVKHISTLLTLKISDTWNNSSPKLFVDDWQVVQLLSHCYQTAFQILSLMQVDTLIYWWDRGFRIFINRLYHAYSFAQGIVSCAQELEPKKLSVVTIDVKGTTAQVVPPSASTGFGTVNEMVFLRRVYPIYGTEVHTVGATQQIIRRSTTGNRGQSVSVSFVLNKELVILVVEGCKCFVYQFHEQHCAPTGGQSVDLIVSQPKVKLWPKPPFVAIPESVN